MNDGKFLEQLKQPQNKVSCAILGQPFRIKSEYTIIKILSRRISESEHK